MDKIVKQNQELVTRKCALESGASSKDKRIQDLESKVRPLESVIMQLEQNAVAPQPASSSGLGRVDTNSSAR